MSASGAILAFLGRRTLCCECGQDLYVWNDRKIGVKILEHVQAVHADDRKVISLEVLDSSDREVVFSYDNTDVPKINNEIIGVSNEPQIHKPDHVQYPL